MSQSVFNKPQEIDPEIRRRANNAYTVCDPCGLKHGNGIGEGKAKMSVSTYHNGFCDICRRKKMVTEFRDYGYSKYQRYE